MGGGGGVSINMSNPQQNEIQNEIEKIKKEINLLQDKLKQSKKRQNLLEKRQSLFQNGLERIVKIQNLSQNELDQITKMQNQLRGELKQIAKMRRIKNYKNMSKERLLIALLGSEQSLAGLYNKTEETKKITIMMTQIMKG